MPDTTLPESYQRLSTASSAPGVPAFHVGILVGPGFLPMDMVGVQTVFGFMPGAQVHLLWKTHDMVEGWRGWWTRPSTTFADCPEKLDVLAVPMLPPEIQNDPEVVAFVAEKAASASYIIGICNGVLALGAAGLLKGRRVTASHNALPVLSKLGAREVVPGGQGTVVDGNLYTAGPGVGSFEAALMVAEAAFGREAAEFAELGMEYDPHPPFGVGTVKAASPAQVGMLEGSMAPMMALYEEGAVAAFARADHAAVEQAA